MVREGGEFGDPSASPRTGQTFRDRAPMVTVAVPLLDESLRLPGLLEAILAQDYPADRMRVMLVDGGSQDGTRELALEASQRYAFIGVVDNPRRVAAAGLNCALSQAEGEIFLRLDARTRPAPDYVGACVRALGGRRVPGPSAAPLTGPSVAPLAGVGGPQVAAGASPAGCIHALALNHPFGAGGPSYRRASKPTLSDTIYLGAYAVAWLRRAGGWDEAFAYNEDYELNTRLREAGGVLLVDPAIHADYLARDSLASLAGQYFHYGRWRTLTIRRHRGAWRWRHLAPALLTAVLFVALLLAPWTAWPLFLLAGVYLGLDVAACLQIALSPGLVNSYSWAGGGQSSTTARRVAGSRVRLLGGWQALPRLLFVFPLLHLSWGAGFWLGVLRRPAVGGELS